MTPHEEAARAIAQADAILIGSGAGMGVDSGLPDFRGDRGFWKAYPPFEKLGLSFIDLANPRWFRDDPTLAWGFYGYRLNLYRQTVPHDGFHLLRRWADALRGGAFVFTSNVDGQFQRAGFGADRVVECHGSIHHLQCVRGCDETIWSADDVTVEIGKDMRAQPPLPTCPRCDGLARPNILMFGDFGWLSDRTDEQEMRLNRWAAGVERLVVVECGAGTTVPSVRYTCEHVASRFAAPLIRINPREPDGPRGTIRIADGALGALTQIDELLAGAR